MAITGAHVLLYTPEADKLRAMLRDALGWKHVDAGDALVAHVVEQELVGRVVVAAQSNALVARRVGRQLLPFDRRAAGREIGGEPALFRRPAELPVPERGEQRDRPHGESGRDGTGGEAAKAARHRAILPSP